MVTQVILLERERRFWEAAGEPEFYREHFADDGVCVLPVGVLDKQETIEQVASAPPWEAHRIEAPRTIQLAEGAAALVYTATARREGDDEDYRTNVTSVYVQRDGVWKLAVHEQAPVDDGG